MSREFINIEKNERITPIKKTLELIDQSNDILISDQTVLIHNFCNTSLKVIEFSSLGYFINQNDLELIVNKNNVYLLEKSYFEESIFKERYSNSFKTLETFKLSVLHKENNFQVLKISIK